MPQLLYLHGSGHTQDSFHDQTTAFSGSDALSLPGHPAGTALTSVEECAAWLSRYLEWKGSEPAVVAGNSLGGAIALQWALDRPDQAAGLVLIGSGARLRVSPEIFAMLEEDWPAGIDTLVDWSLAPSASPELRERAKSWHVTVGRESTKADYTACNGFDVTERLAELNLPTLVLVGDQDRMTPLKYSTYLHQHIHGSILTVVAGAGHLVMAEKPPETNDAIKAFLNTLS